MESFKNKDGIQILYNLIDVIKENKEYLSEIDGAIGDGDHGINMNKGFSKAGDQLNDDFSLDEGLNTLGMTLFNDIGGSMGPLYGTFFINMAEVIEDQKEVDKEAFSKMMNSALDGIQDLGNAKVGDKTLIDTLVPAINTFDEEIDDGKSFSEALEKMKVAAEKGKDSTKDMVAKVGRSARLGERSRGVLDAGATSCYLILKSIANSILDLIK